MNCSKFLIDCLVLLLFAYIWHASVIGLNLCLVLGITHMAYTYSNNNTWAELLSPELSFPVTTKFSFQVVQTRSDFSTGIPPAQLFLQGPTAAHPALRSNIKYSRKLLWSIPIAYKWKNISILIHATHKSQVGVDDYFIVYVLLWFYEIPVKDEESFWKNFLEERLHFRATECGAFKDKSLKKYLQNNPQRASFLPDRLSEPKAKQGKRN